MIKIVTRFLMVSACFIQNGLKVVDMVSPIACKTYSNIIEISNFQQYAATGKTNTDRVDIKINARTIIISGTMLPLEIYTFADSAGLIKADQATNSVGTIITSAPHLHSSQAPSSR